MGCPLKEGDRVRILDHTEEKIIGAEGIVTTVRFLTATVNIPGRGHIWIVHEGLDIIE